MNDRDLDTNMSGRGRGKRAAVKNVVDPTEEEKPVKKISKKKQFPIVAVITPDGIEGNLLSTTRRPLIVHLPIQSRDIPMNDMPIMYDPLPPTDAQPYDSNADNPFAEEVEHIQEMVMDVPVRSEPIVEPTVEPMVKSEAEIDYYALKSTMLVQYHNSAERKEIPMQSDAACFWCCHSFAHRPVVLPIRDTGEYL